MIALVTREQEAVLADRLQAATHPQLLKIKTHYDAYGVGYPFCRFYLLPDGVASWLSGCLTVCASKPSEELADFVKMTGAVTVAVNPEAACPLEGFDRQAGSLMRAEGRRSPSDRLPEGKIDQAYAILSSAYPEKFYPAMRENWYLEMSHYLRHGLSKLYHLEDRATVTVLCENETMAVINQVAVLPQAQRQGLGGRLMQGVLQTLPGKTVFVYSRNPSTDLFYQRQGFEPAGRWLEYHKKELP